MMTSRRTVAGNAAASRSASSPVYATMPMRMSGAA
jgi:hypothetical protein